MVAGQLYKEYWPVGTSERVLGESGAGDKDEGSGEVLGRLVVAGSIKAFAVAHKRESWGALVLRLKVGTTAQTRSLGKFVSGTHIGRLRHMG